MVDLGYGDAGKGTVVDWLCATRPVHTVVRFNGGAQAAHNVVLRDGRHHTFAQFGAGTFHPGVRTHLSRHVVVDPLALAAEADHLATVGVPDALDRLTVDGDALLATPYHRAANRAREIARGADRHGSCGLGVGEAVAYGLAHPDDAPRVADCHHPALLRRRLTTLRDRLTAELGPLDAPPIEDCLPAFTGFAGRVAIVDGSWLAGALRTGTCVFEGAQGVLLDEWHGFHPYTTWSTTTFANVDSLLAEAGRPGDVTRIGVLRVVTTRHGPGPLVTEDPTPAVRRPAQPDEPVAGPVPVRPLRRGRPPVRPRRGRRRRRPGADPPRPRRPRAADLPPLRHHRPAHPRPARRPGPAGRAHRPPAALPPGVRRTANGLGRGGTRGAGHTGGADLARPHRRRQEDVRPTARPARPGPLGLTPTTRSR